MDVEFFLSCTYEDPENPEKRGAKPCFTGSRQELLENHLEEYILLRHRNRSDFWFKLFAKWWEKYPWRLGDKEEPPLNDPARMAELASVGEGEEGAKSKVETELIAVSFRFVVVDLVDLMLDGKHIKGWFAYQAQNKLSRDNNNWFGLL